MGIWEGGQFVLVTMAWVDFFLLCNFSVSSSIFVFSPSLIPSFEKKIIFLLLFFFFPKSAKYVHLIPSIALNVSSLRAPPLRVRIRFPIPVPLILNSIMNVINPITFNQYSCFYHPLMYKLQLQSRCKANKASPYIGVVNVLLLVLQFLDTP